MGELGLAGCHWREAIWHRGRSLLAISLRGFRHPGAPMARYRTQMPAGAPCITPWCPPPIRGLGFFPT